MVMCRWRLAACLAALVVLLHVWTAAACINDSETVRTESEFKKHYELKSGYQEQTAPIGSPTTLNEWVPIAATWSGVGLLLGSVVLVAVNVRKTARR
jgi:hypothetical protein